MATILRATIVLVVVGALAALATAATAATAVPAPAVSAEAVRAFMDEILPRQLAEYRIPGAAVVVVAGGEQVFAQGYGVADAGSGRPVVADRTAFPLDSVSKLFTGTAIMQLVEQGKLDLHTDVNRYLPNFQIPDTYPGQPVTLAHLLTHSAGFEDRVFGLFSTDRQALAGYVAANLPARVRPPGTLPAYSNYSATLAGYLVEVASGMPFERYVQEHLFLPLGMTRTTFAQPPPTEIRAELAYGHSLEAERMVARPHPEINDFPAGSAVATVTDMGRFMLAHLRGNPRMLSEAGRAEMHRHQFGVDPRLPGMALSFFEAKRGDQRLLEHGGDGLGTHGLLALLPEHDAGVYVVYNGDGAPDGPGAGEARQELVDQFVERFFPTPAPGELTLVPGEGAGRFAGTYRLTRISSTDPSKVFAVLLATLRVEASEDGAVETAGLVVSDPTTTGRWVPVGPRLFQEEDGRSQIAFVEDARGRVTGLVMGDDPSTAFEPLAWYQTPTAHAAVAGVSLVLLLSALFRRWRSAARARGVRLARWAIRATALLMAAFVAGLVLLVSDISSFAEALVAGGSPLLNAVLLVPLVAVVPATAGLAVAALVWRQRWWGLASRLHYTAAVAAALAFLALVNAYNLARWPF